MKLKHGLVAAALAASFISNAEALDVANFNSGWYQNDGTSFEVGGNINVGWNPNTGATYRNYLAFDLAGLAGQNITAATLTFYAGNGVNTSSASETLGLFDYSGSIDTLLSHGAGASGYNDLGTGSSYGQAIVSSGAIGMFTISLTADAIAALNAAAGNATDQRFVIGGSLLSNASVHDGDNWWSGDEGQLFAIFGPQAALKPAAFLSVESSPVPLPAALPLLLSGLGAFGVFGRRRKQSAQVA